MKLPGKILAFLLFALASPVFASEVVNVDTDVPMGCGSYRHAYGPFDYTNYEHYTKYLDIVEDYHFSSRVEQLIAGESDTILGDLDYTLRAFPNHHRALIALTKYEAEVGISVQADIIEHMHLEKLSVDCWFQRAITFQPADDVVYLIYATWLHKQGRFEDAQKQYDQAMKMNPNSAELHYNLGLFYYDQNKMELAVNHGHRAYELGYPLPGLKEKLIKKGVWDKAISNN